MFRVLDQAGIYILLALGLNIVVGYAGLLDLGYVAFSRHRSLLLRAPGLAPARAPRALLAGPAGGALLAALFGVLLGAPTLRLCAATTSRSSRSGSGRSSGSS